MAKIKQIQSTELEILLKLDEICKKTILNMGLLTELCSVP